MSEDTKLLKAVLGYILVTQIFGLISRLFYAVTTADQWSPKLKRKLRIRTRSKIVFRKLRRVQKRYAHEPYGRLFLIVAGLYIFAIWLVRSDKDWFALPKWLTSPTTYWILGSTIGLVLLSILVFALWRRKKEKDRKAKEKGAAETQQSAATATQEAKKVASSVTTEKKKDKKSWVLPTLILLAITFGFIYAIDQRASLWLLDNWELLSLFVIISLFAAWASSSGRSGFAKLGLGVLTLAILNVLLRSKMKEANIIASSTPASTSTGWIWHENCNSKESGAIMEAFEDDPTMIRIAAAESDCMHFENDGVTVVTNRSGSSAVGAFQILESVHGKDCNTDGRIDIYTLEGNIECAKILRDSDKGYEHWKESKDKWGQSEPAVIAEVSVIPRDPILLHIPPGGVSEAIEVNMGVRMCDFTLSHGVPYFVQAPDGKRYRQEPGPEENPHIPLVYGRYTFATDSSVKDSTVVSVTLCSA